MAWSEQGWADQFLLRQGDQSQASLLAQANQGPGALGGGGDKNPPPPNGERRMPESPEAIAFELLKAIAANERKDLSVQAIFNNRPDKEWILSTYRECILLVRSGGQSKPE